MIFQLIQVGAFTQSTAPFSRGASVFYAQVVVRVPREGTNSSLRRLQPAASAPGAEFRGAWLVRVAGHVW